jgi:hypothetical protein
MHRGFSPTTLIIGMVALLLVPAIWSFGRLLPDSAWKEELAEGRTSRKSNMLWLLGGLAFLALFSEGVMFDWSAVYIRTVGGLRWRWHRWDLRRLRCAWRQAVLRVTDLRSRQGR